MLPPYSSRIERLRSRLELAAEETSAGNLLVTSLPNIRYLTGFTGSSAVVLLSQQQLILVSDGRYEEQVQRECPGVEAVIRPMGTTMAVAVTQAMARLGGAFLFEKNSISYQAYAQYCDRFDGKLVGVDNMVEDLRAVKDAGEVELIRQSIAINERVFGEICELIDGSQTEREIAAEIEYRGRRYGADGCSFEPIVAVGANAALAHYRPGEVKLNQAPFTLIDWGLFYQGYASDLTRVVCQSEVPEELREIHDVALAAQTAAIEAIKPGLELKELDRVARSVIADAGFGEQFSHSLGHGIGLEIHEGPGISPTAQGQLIEGMVITIEPGIYVPGLGGVRIEDDVWVTADGCEVLSTLPKNVLVDG